MNSSITKIQHERLCDHNYREYQFGSRLFRCEREDSDYDYLRIYKFEDVFPFYKNSYTSYLPNKHSFKYTDSGTINSIENNVEYIWISESQFYTNLYNGDGTIYSDIYLFTDIDKEVDKLLHLRTHKIIKSYLGIAKRELKLHNTENKLFHANRSYYIASKLIDNEYPLISDIIKIKDNLISREELYQLVLDKKESVNKMFNNKELFNYHIDKTDDDLFNVIIENNNVN